MSYPKISIITPTYNSAKHLKACILSVAQQSYTNKEHLIVDNLSTDETVEIVRKYALQYPHIRLISEKDHGIYDAMNKGIEKCSGDWLYFIGCDDTFYNDDVLSCIFCSHEIEQMDVIYGNVEWGKGGPLYDGLFTPLKLLNKNICHQAIFFTRDLFYQLGGFETKYKALADWVFNMQWFFRENSRIHYLDQTIAVYNPDGYSSNNKDQIFIDERKAIVHNYFPEEYALIFDLNTKIVDLDNEVNQLITTVSRKEQENNTLQTTIENLYTHIDTLQYRIDTLETAIHKMAHSSSWRMTKPIRNLSHSIRKRSRKIRSIFNKSEITDLHKNTPESHDYSCNFSILYNEFLLSSEFLLDILDVTVDIIIPVFNERSRLEELCKSIVHNTSSPYRLILIDDGSTDEKVYPFLQQFKYEHPQLEIVLLKNPTTIGFLQSVHHAAKSSTNHFVILNSCSELPPGWLERLMRPIIENTSIATTTPFTNDDSLSTVLASLKDDNHGINLLGNNIDRFFKNLTPINNYPDISSGSGFCMGVNRMIFNHITISHTKSGRKEHGDEMEWCINAIKKGYRNILVPNLFVSHHRNGTASDSIPVSKQFKKKVSHNKYLQAYPLREIGQFLKLYLLSTDISQSNCILFIDHDLGGGANLYRNNYIKREVESGHKILLFTFNFHRKTYDLTFVYNNHNLAFYATNIEQIKNILTKYVKIDSIILSETVSFPTISNLLDLILSLQETHNAKLTTLIHDYFCICPCYTLLDHNDTFCGPPDNISHCLNCLPQNNQEFRIFYKNPDIIFWRRKWKYVLDQSHEIICFSNASKEILLKAYPNIPYGKILVKPHGTDHLNNLLLEENLSTNRQINTDILRIGILGNIQIPKGAAIVEKMLAIIEEEQKNIQIIIIGEIATSVNSKHLKITGKYTHDSLPHIIQTSNIDIFLIPAIWPETFSYTSEEIMQMNLPLAVFNIGAPAERAIHYNKALIISKIDARTALDEITNYISATCSVTQN